jgi:hypothetical protein
MKTPNSHSDAPTFTPVAQRLRHDGLTPERQTSFIEALAASGSVSLACARAGVSREAVYQLRRKPDAESFAVAWEAALRVAVDVLADVVMGNAISGETIPQYYKGELIGERVKYDARLQMFLLRVHDTKRYGKQIEATYYLTDVYGKAKIALNSALNLFRRGSNQDSDFTPT